MIDDRIANNVLDAYLLSECIYKCNNKYYCTTTTTKSTEIWLEKTIKILNNKYVNNIRGERNVTRRNCLN